MSANSACRDRAGWIGQPTFAQKRNRLYAVSDTKCSNCDIDAMSRPRRFGFLLIDDFALMSFASAVEPLRAANILAGQEFYSWSHISTGARAIVASNGV